MATFSVNQSRQLYVVGKETPLKTPKVVDTDDAGSISIDVDTAKTQLYFLYKGADSLLRTDLIDLSKVESIKATDADTMKHSLRKTLVTLNTEVNSGNLVGGQDYILRLVFRHFVGMSDEDVTQKYGTVHAYSGMTASDFYKLMAISLAKNFCKDAEAMLTFQLQTASDPVDVTAYTKASDLTGTYTGVLINEAEQEWVLGITPQTFVDFTVQYASITYNGDERIWGTTTEQTPTVVLNNGKNIADMEYFYMGERGDIYRSIGFPHNIRTTYLVDSTIAYNTLDIQYFYAGPNEDVQKSQKTCTLVIPKIGKTNAVSNVLTNSIITALNTATGLSIPLLSVA